MKISICFLVLFEIDWLPERIDGEPATVAGVPEANRKLQAKRVVKIMFIFGRFG